MQSLNPDQNNLQALGKEMLPAETLKRRRTPGRKFATPRKPRVIDPSVLAIRREASEKIKALHQANASPKVLERIVNQLGKLTGTDSMKLKDRLDEMIEPATRINETSQPK